MAHAAMLALSTTVGTGGIRMRARDGEGKALSIVQVCAFTVGVVLLPFARLSFCECCVLGVWRRVPVDAGSGFGLAGGDG